MKIIFFGSDDFAVTHLEGLLANGHDVACCVTGPDKPQGRGMKMTPSIVKLIAERRHIACLQPVSLNSGQVVDQLKAFAADLFVVVAYGRLLTKEVLELPGKFCVNVHASLLPKYRGAAPINWAILNGEKETGVTVQKMALALDAGDVIGQEPVMIAENENAAQLRKRMADTGARLLVNVLSDIAGGEFSLTPQNEALVTFAPKLTKEMGIIDWKVPAKTIMARLRGLYPWPGAYTFYNGKILKVTQAEIVTGPAGKYPSGHVTQITREGFYVACADQDILIKEVQPEAGKVMSAQSFLAGHKLTPGIALGR